MTQFVFLFSQTAYEQAKEVHEAFSHTFKEITNIMMNNSPWFGQELWTARKVIAPAGILPRRRNPEKAL